MKAYWLLLVGFLISSISIGQVKKTYEDENHKVVYELRDGRIHGTYQSYYPNGHQRALGEFENNYRTGKWIVWDSTGKKQIERVYSSPFVFEQKHPGGSKEGPIPILSEPVYKIKYNDEGYIDYFPLEERMIVWAKRIWRKVPADNNLILFNDKLFQKKLFNLIKTSELPSYGTKNDIFQEEVDLSSVDFDELDLVAFKLKEEWFFDCERFVMECRIIGICPVVESSGDTTDLCWIYFPELRPYIANVSIESNKTPDYIHSLDDLFFYRDFASTIYKESNVYNQEIADYTAPDMIEKEAERIELSIIELEHDTWINFAGSNDSKVKIH